MYRVTKRDGSITEFHIAKIGNAITRAFEAVGRQQHPSNGFKGSCDAGSACHGGV